MKAYPHQETALKAMENSTNGLIVIPTGGGKTFIIAKDILHNIGGVTVVVAPRILLAQQLSKEIDSIIGGKEAYTQHFVYSGEAIEREMEALTPEQITDTSFSSCSPTAVKDEFIRSIKNKFNLILYTTYHSLGNIIESGIPINNAYLDEAHNATSHSFHSAVRELSGVSERMYSFSATPKIGSSINGRGNNNSGVFGEVICEVPANELIGAGVIVPPMVNNLYTGLVRDDKDETCLSRDTIIQTIEHYDNTHCGYNHKILVAADGTKTINELRTQTNLIEQCGHMGYDVFMVTSTYGHWLNNTEIKGRTEFLEILKQYGSDPNKKLLVIHHSILSEGIDVPGLTGCLLLRNMNMITMTQTIGRVLRMLKVDRNSIRKGEISAGEYVNYQKPYGLVTLPIHKDDGEDMDSNLGILYNSIMGMGIPPANILNEEGTRGVDELALPDDIHNNIQQKIKEISAEWEWVYRQNIVYDTFKAELDLL